MLDFYWTKLSLGLSFVFNLTFLSFVFFYYRKCVQKPQWHLAKRYFGLVFLSLFLIIVTVPLDSGDWFHYQEDVKNYNFNFEGSEEPVYSYIIWLTNKNYFLFRLLVWGGGFLLSCLVFKRFNINQNVAIYFLIAVYLTKFNYARASLAMASYFLGLSYLFRPINKHKLLSMLLVAILFFAAFSFHRSLFPLLSLSIVAFLPTERLYFYIPSLFLIPTMAAVLVENNFYLDWLGMDILLNKFSIYEQMEDDLELNFWGVFRNVLGYGSLIIPLVINTYLILRNKKYIELYILKLFRVMIAIIFLSLLFLFIDLTTTVFFFRYFVMIFIPLTVISVYLYYKKIMSRIFFSIIVIWGIRSLLVLHNFQNFVQR